MKFLFTICFFTGWLTAAAQVPTTAPKSTTAPAKELTPAEIRQKERVAKVLEEERKLREDIAKAQRDYRAKQAEKERQRKEKEDRRQAKEAAPAPVVISEPVAAPEPPKASKPEKPAKTPTATSDTANTSRPAEPTPEPERTAAPSVPDAAKAQREAQRRQEQTQRDLLRQQQQDERNTRRAERAKTRTEQETATTTLPAAAPEATGVPGREFLPRGHLFAPILLDPLEAQTYISVLPAFRTDGRNYPGSIVPFTFGFCKPFFRWTKFPGRASELSLDVASFTQFEVYHDDVRNTQKRQLINTDYKFSVIYNLLLNNHSWRFRFYHLSSHLGDDYLFRNAIQAYTPNSVNYEIVDATYSKTVAGTRLYGGIGVGLRKPEERKLLSGHAGFYYRNVRTNRLVRVVGGADLKVWQQTDFRPGIKGVVGIELGKPANPVTFVLEGYTGFRPYSQYENQHVRWLGIGFYFNPI